MRARRGGAPGARRTSTLPEQLARDGRRGARVERRAGSGASATVTSVTRAAAARRSTPSSRRAEPPVGLERRQHRRWPRAGSRRDPIARHQPVAQEQEGGLRDVGQAVAAGAPRSGRRCTAPDLAAVDAALAGQADRARGAVERGHPGGAVVGDDVAQVEVPLLAEAVAVALAPVVPAEVERRGAAPAAPAPAGRSRARSR